METGATCIFLEHDLHEGTCICVHTPTHACVWTFFKACSNSLQHRLPSLVCMHPHVLAELVIIYW